MFSSWLIGSALALLPSQASAPPGVSPEVLSRTLRDTLVHMLPDPLYEAAPGWGKQQQTTTGLKWTKKGPRRQHGERNEGTWRKIRVVADRAADTLDFHLRDIRSADTGKVTFTADAALNVRVDYEKQDWHKGVRLYAGSIRARLRIHLTVQCELSSRLEFQKGALLPDAIFQVRVVHAETGYDNLVVEHIAGVGGDLARWLGKTGQKGLHRFDPRVEEKLLARANAAIEKAGRSKELRLGLSALWKN